MHAIQTAPETNPPAQVVRIPFHFVANQIRIDATIQGAGPFHLILDTGMPITGVMLFHNPAVDALDLADSGSRIQVTGAGGDGGSSEATMAGGLAVGAGDWKVEDTTALLIAEPAGFPPGIDGVIGGELFFHHVVRIDVDESRLELSESKGWTPPASACVVPFDRVANKIFVDVRVAVGAEEPKTAHVVVDTGASHALSLNSGGAGGFAPPAGALATQIGRGASGAVMGEVARVRRVEIGTFAFENVVTTFPVAKHQNPGGEDFHDGNLGEEILRRFVVSFDYAGKRMVLEKGKAFAEPFEHEMAGLVLDWEGDGGVVVRGVLPGSPAEGGGIEAGDRIRSIDGKTIAEIGDQGLKKALRVEGAELSISIQRGSEVLVKKIRLHRLV